MTIVRSACRPLSFAACASFFAVSAFAQGVYPIVGPNGKVIGFSDQPAPSTSPARAVGNTNSNAPSAAPDAQLPFELRQVTARYPVTLYTSKDCAPCNSGRNMLNARGIPYNERTIETPQDADALKRLSGETSLPLLTIGTQQLKGYSDTEWTQYLNAAGYPKQSILPPGYRRAAAAPLVVVRTEPSPAANAGPASPSTAPAPGAVPVAPPVNNPAGIRF